jgi:hypothetical protein
MKTNGKAFYTVGLVVAVIAIIFIVKTTHLAAEQKAATDQIASLKCPEVYATQDEKMSAFLAFGNNYVIVNPNAKGNLAIYDTARTDFLIARHCTATLKNFGYDGVSTIDAKVRQEIIVAMEKNDATPTTVK